MMHQKSILFLILLFYFGCNENGQAPPPPFPQVTLSASEPSIEVDNVVTLYVNVANISDLYAISFEIMYDHSILDIDMEAGAASYDQFTSDNFGPVVYSDDGVLSFVFGGNNINGKIFSFTVQGINFGTTDVELNSVNSVQYIDGEIEENYSSISLENVNLIISE